MSRWTPMIGWLLALASSSLAGVPRPLDAGVAAIDGGAVARAEPVAMVDVSGTVRRLSGDRLGHVVVRATKVHGGVIPSGEFGLFPEFHAEVAADGRFTLARLPRVDVALQATDGSSHSAVVVLRAEALGQQPVHLELDDRAPHLGPDDQPGTE